MFDITNGKVPSVMQIADQIKEFNMVRLDKKSFEDDGLKEDAYVEEEYVMENNMFRVRNLLKATITVPKAEEMMDVYNSLYKNDMFDIIHVNNIYQKGVATKNL